MNTRQGEKQPILRDFAHWNSIIFYFHILAQISPS